MFGKKITSDMSIVHIISTSPLARNILLNNGIKFVGRGLSPLESLEKVAKGNGLSDKEIGKIIDELNTPAKRETKKIIEVSQTADEKLKELIKSKPGKKGIRLRLVSDGCSTYVYDMDFATKRVENEAVVKAGGVTFFVDPKTIDFIKGTTIDYSTKEGGFIFQNPNVKSDS